MSLALGLEHSCPWPREGLSSERLSLASDFFCVLGLGLGLKPCVLDSTSAGYTFKLVGKIELTGCAGAPGRQYNLLLITVVRVYCCTQKKLKMKKQGFFITFL